MLGNLAKSAIDYHRPTCPAPPRGELPIMHPLLLYISILATASAVWLPLLPRMEEGGPCGEFVATYELDVLDGPTADGTAGLGIEFESPFFYFKKDGCSLTDTNAAKTKIISGRIGRNWELTADTGGGAGTLNAEYILNGKNIKVGDGSAAEAASAAAQDLVSAAVASSPRLIWLTLSD